MVAVQKKNNIVGPFIGEWYALNPYASSPFVGRIGDNLYELYTVQHAITALQITYGTTDTHQTMLTFLANSSTDPRLAKSYARRFHYNANGLLNLADLFNLLCVMYSDVPTIPNHSIRYTGNSSAQQVLLRTAQQDIVYFNYWHDNHLGVCACQKCQGLEALNLYGLMLMAIRRMTTLSLLDTYVQANSLRLDEETVYVYENFHQRELTWRQVRNGER